MKVCAILHRPTSDLAGAEQMLGAVLRHLESAGHEVTEIATRKASLATEASEGADVLLTHLDATKAASVAAFAHEVPLVAFQHNTFKHQKLQVQRSRVITALVFNSMWMEQAWTAIRPDLPRMIVHPPVDPAMYERVGGSDRYVSQINLYKNGKMIFDLARLMPDTEFLAVQGGYGTQYLPSKIPDNVEIQLPTNEIVWDVYARTRVLLVPSKYESWGRVGLEAASSGIPVIASAVPGLQESLGHAGLFRDYRRTQQWVEALESLTSPGVYSAYSRMARERALQVWSVTQEQLAEFERFLDVHAETGSAYRL